ncbi:hypothetical protein SESBI_50649, partial [Sesbania bispinosa]
MEFDPELELPLAHFKRKSKKGLHIASGQPSIQVSTTPLSSPKRESERQPIMAGMGNGDRRTLEDYSQPRPRNSTPI